MIGLYRLSTLLPAWKFDQRLWLAIVLQITLTLCDVGSLILIYAIAGMDGKPASAKRAIFTYTWKRTATAQGISR